VPITPFHLGPGLAVKAVAEERFPFSLVVFGFSQVLIDLEPAVGLARGAAVLHGFSHTYVGATLLAVVTIVIGPPVCEWIARRMNRSRQFPTFTAVPWPEHIDRPAAVSGAFIGTYSHVLLDGVMHLDMHALAPFSLRQPLLGLVSVRTLYLFCVLCGVAGGLALRDRLRYRSLPDRCG
jgi:hypothetical protein